MSHKAEVRDRMRELPVLSPEEHRLRSKRICQAILGHSAWQRARMVATFAAISGEPDVDGLWVVGFGKTFCYPRVRGQQLDFLRVGNLKELEVSRWKVREPMYDAAQVVDLRQVDLILVPGVAFGRRGERLGRGGGYYDRALAQPDLVAVKLGVCFEAQLMDALRTEPHDVPMDAVVTEEGVK